MAVAIARVIARRHEQAGDASSTTSGMPPASVATIGFAAGHRVEQRGAEPFGDRAHDEQDRTPLMQPTARRSGSRAAGRAFRGVVAHLFLELLAQLAFAEDHEPRIGDLAHDQVRRLDEVPLPLCGPGAATLPTTGAWCGSQNASWTFTGGAAATCSTSMPSCTVTVALGRNAVGDEHLPDGLGGGDEAVRPAGTSSARASCP